MAVIDRHAVDLGFDHGLQIQFDEVTGLEGQELLDRGRRGAQFGHQLNLGVLNLVLEQIDPAPIRLKSDLLYAQKTTPSLMVILKEPSRKENTAGAQ